MLTTFLFFVLILLLAQNENIEHIENIEEKLKSRKFKITLYNVEIVTWKNYDQTNFFAKVKKLENPFYSNYIYSEKLEIYKNFGKNLARVFLPYAEIYTNLQNGKTKNIKIILYTKDEKNNFFLTYIYSNETFIKNKKILLLKNFIYTSSQKTKFFLYYPKMEIYLN
ncbi:MAG: hypothetical protein ACK4GJ_00745 [bacterium]